MNRQKIDIKAGRLFPFHFLLLAGVLLVAALLVVAEFPITAAILSVIAILILTAYEGTEIDFEKRTVREYYAFLFIKTGGARKYSHIEGISIHSAKISQNIFTPRTMSSSTFSHVEYHAYLKFNGEKIFLFGNRNKTKVLERARKAAQILRTSVADHAIIR